MSSQATIVKNCAKTVVAAVAAAAAAATAYTAASAAATYIEIQCKKKMKSSQETDFIVTNAISANNYINS